MNTEINSVQDKNTTKNKRKKKSASQFVSRTESDFTTAGKALQKLLETEKVQNLGEIEIVKKNLNLICELKAKGVNIARIHDTLVDAVKLRISVSTFKRYVNELSAKPKADKKPVSKTEPVQEKKQEISPEMANAILQHLKTNEVKCPHCNNKLIAGDCKTSGGNVFFACKCGKNTDAKVLCGLNK